MYPFILMKVNGVNCELYTIWNVFIKCILHIQFWMWASFRRKSNIPKAKRGKHYKLYNHTKMNALILDSDKPLFARPHFSVCAKHLFSFNASVTQARNKQHKMYDTYLVRMYKGPMHKINAIPNVLRKVKKKKCKRFESQNPFNSGESVSYSNGMHQHPAFCVILLFRQMIV